MGKDKDDCKLKRDRTANPSVIGRPAQLPAHLFLSAPCCSGNSSSRNAEVKIIFHQAYVLVSPSQDDLVVGPAVNSNPPCSNAAKVHMHLRTEMRMKRISEMWIHSWTTSAQRRSCLHCPCLNSN